MIESEAKLLLYCPECTGTRFGKFCTTCGTALVPIPPPRRCSKCGEEVESSIQQYCRWCGERVD